MYKVEFIENRGSLIVNDFMNSKTGNTVKLFIGECTCYKNNCNCVKEIIVSRFLINQITRENSKDSVYYESNSK